MPKSALHRMRRRLPRDSPSLRFPLVAVFRFSGRFWWCSWFLGISSASVSARVKPGTHFSRVPLLSADSDHEAEVAVGWTDGVSTLSATLKKQFTISLRVQAASSRFLIFSRPLRHVFFLSGT